jgi:hypothetical protein
VRAIVNQILRSGSASNISLLVAYNTPYTYLWQFVTKTLLRYLVFISKNQSYILGCFVYKLTNFLISNVPRHSKTSQEHRIKLFIALKCHSMILKSDNSLLSFDKSIAYKTKKQEGGRVTQTYRQQGDLLSLFYFSKQGKYTKMGSQKIVHFVSNSSTLRSGRTCHVRLSFRQLSRWFRRGSWNSLSSVHGYKVLRNSSRHGW